MNHHARLIPQSVPFIPLHHGRNRRTAEAVHQFRRQLAMTDDEYCEFFHDFLTLSLRRLRFGLRNTFLSLLPERLRSRQALILSYILVSMSFFILTQQLHSSIKTTRSWMACLLGGSIGIVIMGRQRPQAGLSSTKLQKCGSITCRSKNGFCMGCLV